MGKTGIMTFHRAVNYGAVLQTYALCRKLAELGVESEVIDYRCPAVENCYYHLLPRPLRPKQLVKNILGQRRQSRRNEQFLRFVKQYLPVSDYRTDNPEELKVRAQDYEYVIAGSDQIWNQLCAGGDKAYYLEFVEEQRKRISYAASFGRVAEEYKRDEDYRRLLHGFSALSVREVQGQEIVREMTGRSAQLCLDPSFLLDRQGWEPLLHPVEEPYIFVYSLNMPDALAAAAEQIAAAVGHKVVYITLNNIFRKTGWQDASDSGPEGFLSYMASARYVVTNSFHGTAFSIIFKREFFFQPHVDPNIDNSRMTNLLTSLGLEERLLNKDAVPDLSQRVNYGQADRILERLKQDSVNYLKDALNIKGERK